jgi:hypothetical protein
MTLTGLAQEGLEGIEKQRLGCAQAFEIIHYGMELMRGSWRDPRVPYRGIFSKLNDSSKRIQSIYSQAMRDLARQEGLHHSRYLLQYGIDLTTPQTPASPQDKLPS